MKLLDTLNGIRLDMSIFEEEFPFLNSTLILEASSRETNVMEIISDVLNKYNGEDVYISFRDSITTNLINPENIYRTPTGFYAYPLGPVIKNKLGITNWSELKSMDKNTFFSSRLFPWRSDVEFLYLFHISNTSNVLYSSKDNKSKLDKYVERLLSIYGDNETVEQLCKKFLSTGKVYSTRYRDNFIGVQAIWMLIFEVGIAIKTNYPLNYFFTFCCNKIGIDAFVDDAGIGYIHMNEPHNSVFFKLKSIADYFNIVSKTKGERFSLPRSSEVLSKKYGVKKYKYEKSGKIGRF